MYDIIFLIGVIVGLIITNVYWRIIKPDGVMLIHEKKDKKVKKMLI